MRVFAPPMKCRDLYIRYHFLRNEIDIAHLCYVLGLSGHASRLIVDKFGNQKDIQIAISSFERDGPMPSNFSTQDLTIDLDGEQYSSGFLSALRLCAFTNQITESTLGHLDGANLQSFTKIIKVIRNTLQHLTFNVYGINYETVRAYIVISTLNMS